MSGFDPYNQWLGIPPEEQPPNHYGLLGVPLFTDDTERIAQATQQRMSHLRSLHTGPHAAFCQKLLNEIARASACLRNAESKTLYDKSLCEKQEPKRSRLLRAKPLHSQAHPAAADKQPAPAAYASSADNSSRPGEDESASAVEPVVVVDTAAVAPQTQPAHRRRRRIPTWIIVGLPAASVAAAIVGYVLLCLVVPGLDFLDLFGKRANNSVASAKSGGGSSNSESGGGRLAASAKRFSSADDSGSARREGSSSLSTGSLGQGLSQRPPQQGTATWPDPDTWPHQAGASQERLGELLSARDEAIAKGDVAAALDTAREIARHNFGDGLKAQLAAARQMQTTADSRLLAEQLLQLLEQAVQYGRHDLAKEYQDDLLVAARDAADPELLRRTSSFVLKKIEQIDFASSSPVSKWTDLLAQIDVERDVVSGTWTRVPDGAIQGRSDRGAQITMPSMLPKDYVMEVTFARVLGSNDVSVMIPVGDRHCMCMLSGFGGRASGIQMVDGADIRTNVTSVRPGTIRNNQQYMLRINVALGDEDRTAHIEVELNDLPYISYHGPIEALGASWPTPAQGIAQLCVFESAAVFYSARVREK